MSNKEVVIVSIIALVLLSPIILIVLISLWDIFIGHTYK
jgi:uncharacterized membrane protein YqhA